MDRFDPSAHANYVTTLLLIAIALERLVSTPRTHAVAVVVGRVRALEVWVQARVPALARRPKLWTELALLAAALTVRMAAFVVVDALSR